MVKVGSFTISILAAVLLQVLLRATIAFEHRVRAYFSSRPGGMAKFLRISSAVLILFVSKFIMLAALDLVFGDQLLFRGPFHGVFAFVAVVVAMLVAEEFTFRFYRRLSPVE